MLIHRFAAISTSAVAGSSLVFPSELYDPAAALHCIERYQCTALYGVTTMFITEMAAPSFAKTNKSSLKYLFTLPPTFRNTDIPPIH